MALTLAAGLPPGQTVPSIIDGGDLETYDKLGWLVFENLLVIQDRCVHASCDLLGR